MSGDLLSPPVLSTPDTHILEEVPPTVTRLDLTLSDDQLRTRYEIERTIHEIRERRWQRVALQFPDHMLSHSVRVYELLASGLNSRQSPSTVTDTGRQSRTLDAGLVQLDIDQPPSVRLTILGDTSYGSCCVDEIAAEHVSADAVVHYGRACLSPTSRLPVLHIFTVMELDRADVTASFQQTFPDRQTKVIVTADVPYAHHVPAFGERLHELGYTDVFAASIVHDPSSSIPNRTVPPSVTADPASLAGWHFFHISEPPTSLILTLASRVASIRVYPCIPASPYAEVSSVANSTRLLLRRRYALVTSLATVAVWGILINTLSVNNYLDILSHIQRQIAAAGKKSYLFVVGKLNAAKVANFADIGGWIVIGCWESSLIDSKDFYRPIITPFELELALQTDDSRLWTGEWRADFQSVLEDVVARKQSRHHQDGDLESAANGGQEHNDQDPDIETDSASESEPPEFDLRTGRYVSRTRPLQGPRSSRHQQLTGAESGQASSSALARRRQGDIIAVNGIASPAAEYLSQKRTWRGLGSDHVIEYDHDESPGGLLEEGRTGVARGYTVGESPTT